MDGETNAMQILVYWLKYNACVKKKYETLVTEIYE